LGEKKSIPTKKRRDGMKNKSGGGGKKVGDTCKDEKSNTGEEAKKKVLHGKKRTENESHKWGGKEARRTHRQGGGEKGGPDLSCGFKKGAKGRWRKRRTKKQPLGGELDRESEQKRGKRRKR